MSTTGSDPEKRWLRLAELFDEVVALSPHERRAYLDRACRDDPDLRRQVVDLLRSSDRASGFLERPVHSQAPSLVAEAARDLKDGETIGAYRLVEKVGEGGMGEVWRAQQTAPIRRQVALKVIKAGMDTREVVARFQAERQALAWMDHPTIARAFDAGETPRGLPYFAMEFVEGEPITTFCDRRELSLRERLALVIQVCEGVQHAHQRGIIHRDLKPSNVLISILDDRPVPKIIDFGVAKATAGRLTETTLLTGLGMVIGTLEYMSPEQAELTEAGVDTRTDVYALGVLLYELLTGTLPFDFRELRTKGFGEIRRRIRETEPERPSLRNRRTGQARRFGEELDWIVLRAMAKERTQRYATPGDLAADLGRYLRNEPVVAGSPGTFYRARKFVRRHRLGVAIAMAAVTGLIGIVVATSVQSARVAKERDRADREAVAANRITDFLAGLFRVADPGEAPKPDITARELLDRGAEKIRDELDSEPLIRARLLLTMGSVYANLGLHEEAEAYVETSLDLRRDLLGPGDPDTLAAMHLLASIYWEEDRYAEAEELARRAFDLRRQALGDDDRSTLASADLLATIYAYGGKPRDAVTLLVESLEKRRKAPAFGGVEDLQSLSILGDAEVALGRYPVAERHLREAFDLLRAHGRENLDALLAHDRLGLVCFLQGKYEDSASFYREGLDRGLRMYGPEHPVTLRLQAGVAATEFLLGRREPGLAAYRRVFETSRRLNGPDDPFTQLWSFGVGMMLLFEHRYAEAEAIFRDVSAVFARDTGPLGYNTLWALDGLAVCRHHQGDLEEAESLLRGVVDANRRALGPEHPHTRDSLRHLAEVYTVMGREPDAERLFIEAAAPAPPDTWHDPRVTAAALFGLAGIEVRRDGARAMVRLRHAVELGFDDVTALAHDRRFDPLRSEPGFPELIAIARANSNRPPSSPVP